MSLSADDTMDNGFMAAHHRDISDDDVTQRNAFSRDHDRDHDHGHDHDHSAADGLSPMDQLASPSSHITFGDLTSPHSPSAAAATAHHPGDGAARSPTHALGAVGGGHAALSSSTSIPPVSGGSSVFDHPSLSMALGHASGTRLPQGPCCAVLTDLLAWQNRVTHLQQQLLLHPQQPHDVGHDGDVARIAIAYYVKAAEISGASYMAFVIQSEFPSAPGVIETKRRYSEFESLAKILARAHPAIVVPPIPEKHAISDYATKTAKVREDPSLLNRRQRQLQTFLNRVAQHPVLSREHIFHQFLVATTTSWTDLLAQSDQSHLLRKQRSGSLRFTDNLKLTDKSTAPLKNPEPRFAAAERYTSQFLEQMQHTYRVQKRIGKQHVDMMQTLAELGHKYNSFSLSLDHHTLGPLLEFFGEAFDKTVPITERFYKAQDASATDTLHEYAQFAQTIEGLLRARHRKQADLEGTVDSIAAKRATLAQLEASEQESQRIAAIVNAEGFRGSGFGTSGTSPHSAGHSSASTTLGGVPPSNGSPYGTTAGVMGTKLPAAEGSAETANAPFASANASGALAPPGTQAGAGAGTGGAGGSPYARPVVMGTSYYSGGSLLASINSLLDHDPEASRRNQISKTREKIVQLEAAQARLEVELAETNATLAEDLDRFQAGKVRDIKAMLTTLCRQQITHANEMREVWQAFSLPSCK